MRIAVVTPWFPSAKNPVQGIFVEKEAHALRDSGQDVRVIYLDRDAKTINREIRDGLPVLTLPVDIRKPIQMTRHADLLRSALSFADVVHSQAISSLPMLSMIRPDNWVHTEHWSGVVRPESLSPRIRWLQKPAVRLFRLPTVVVGVTEQLNRTIRRLRPGRQVELVPCVVHEPTVLTESPGGNVLRLVSVGGLIDGKDPLLAVRTLKILQNEGVPVSLRWAGQGPLMEEARSLANQLDVDADFIGAVSPEQVQQELLDADIFFGPTKGDNFFVSAAEALVCGRPVCVGSNGGHVDYIPDAYGEIVSDQTPQAYADAIIRLRDKTADVSAREIADSVKDRFSPEAVASMLGEIYDKVVKPRVLVVSRIHLPEPAAASLRWDVIERALVGAGFRVDVITSRFDAEANDPVGVTVKRWPVLRDKEGNLRGYIPYLSFDLPVFGRILAAKRPDVVMVEPPPTTGVVARVACALRGLPYIWYAADTWSSGTKSMGAPRPVVAAVEWMEKTAIRGARAVIAVTNGVRDGVQQMGAVAVARVPNGIDVDTYNIDEPSTGPDFPRFAYTGTASEFQGADLLLDAFEQLLKTNPDTQLYFVGSGSDWSELRERAEYINAAFKDGIPRVVVGDQCTPKEVSDLLNSSVAALVSISPQHGGDTPYPTKILAALATGTPVIYAGPGEAVEDIEEYDLGWAVDYDLDQVTQAMRAALAGDVLSSPQKMREWVVNNRSTAAMGQMVVDVVNQVLETE